MPGTVEAVKPPSDLLDAVPPLVGAAARGDVAAVQQLLDDRDPNEADIDGWSALHAAAVFDHASVVELLLAAGADVDARTTSGFTPLLNAAQAGAEVARALLQAGADPDAQADSGWRPLDRFASYGNAHGLRLIIASTKLSVDVRDDDHEPTALMDAAEVGSVECAELLVAAGADLRLRSDGRTAAEFALEHGHTALAERLMA